MTPKVATQKLSKIANIYLKEETDSVELEEATDEFKNLMFEISRLDFNATVNKENIQLSTGIAIGPKWAGICIEDVTRTKKFICGINKAINDLKRKGHEGPVTILYSGTGPFAALVLPLIALFKPSELQFVFLEVNEISIQSLKKVIKAFDAYEYITGFYHCDAGNFEIPSEFDIDILLIECLQHALVREPQVGITYNLLPQMKEDIILIPEQVTLHISIIDNDLKNEYLKRNDGIRHLDYFEISRPIFILNKAEVRRIVNNKENGVLAFSEEEVIYSDEELAKNDTLAIATEITIYDDQKLTLGDSGATVPFIISNLNLDTDLKGLKAKYVIGLKPGLEVTFVYK